MRVDLMLSVLTGRKEKRERERKKGRKGERKRKRREKEKKKRKRQTPGLLAPPSFFFIYPGLSIFRFVNT